MDLQKYLHVSNVTRRIAKADLVLKNVNVINVFSEEVYQADIAICEGVIAGVGTYSGKHEVDLTGFYASPGFIDCHLHVESTLVTPKELIQLAARRGTTTFIVDPHEAANVSGCDGIDYILEQTEDVPANVYVMIPSCVPATEMEDNGATLTAKELARYLGHPRVLGLGEVMDCKAVITGNPGMHQKLGLFSGLVIDGHAPFLDPYDLSAYALAGISTDHECIDFDYAMEEIRRGLTVLIREGSGAKNLYAIVRGIVENKVDTTNFCFCTDDKHTEDIVREGHINYNVNAAIGLGIDPVRAIKMATLQAARCYGLKQLGAIAPGYQADLLIFDNLEKMNIQQVYHKGTLVSMNDPIETKPCPANLKNTVHLHDFSKSELLLEKTSDEFPVIKVVEKQIITEEVLVELPGVEFFQPNDIYKKIAVVERHGKTGDTGVGVIMGFDINHGAVASSVSHDSHNIIVIGSNDEDMVIAVNELIRTQGGYTIVEEGKVYATLELPIMGLMSEAGYEEVNSQLAKMKEKVCAMGVAKEIDPFATMSFMALPVLPEIRVTSRGVYSVKQKRLWLKRQNL